MLNVSGRLEVAYVGGRLRERLVDSCETSVTESASVPSLESRVGGMDGIGGRGIDGGGRGGGMSDGCDGGGGGGGGTGLMRAVPEAKVDALWFALVYG